MSQTTVDITLDGIDLEVTGDYEPYIPAVLNRAPEDCSPDEGGYFELDCIENGTLDLTALLSDRHEEIEELCYDALQD